MQKILVYIFKYCGILNVYRKGELDLETKKYVEKYLKEGLNASKPEKDKENLSGDFSRVKKDINKSW